MLAIYDAQGQGLAKREAADSCEAAVWIDLVNPTKEEEASVERMLGIEIPTREELGEIELSSRIYSEDGAHFLTATVIHQGDTPAPLTTTITFILTDKRLVTVRYAEPKAFPIFLSRAGKGETTCGSAMAIMVGILEAVIDRQADLVERLQLETEKAASTIFDLKGGAGTRQRRYDVVLKQLGKAGETASKARESLLSLERVLTYMTHLANTRREDDGVRRRIKTETRDVVALSDHITYLSGRQTFMLEAVIGMVSIEQNQIIKLFSVAAVMLMPPTLVASVYGMNFKHMPELEWQLGYPFALLLMVLGAVLPFFYFKRKGWL